MIYFQSQVDRLLAEKEKQIEILHRQIEKLEERTKIAETRATNAIDQLLSANGRIAITPPPPREKSTVENLIESVSHHLGAIGEEVGEEPKGDKINAIGK